MTDRAPDLYAVIVETWLSRTRNGALMLDCLLQMPDRLGVVSSFCGGKDGKAAFVPEWVKQMLHADAGVTLAGLHGAASPLRGRGVRLYRKGEWWNIAAPCPKWALSDDEALALERDAPQLDAEAAAEAAMEDAESILDQAQREAEAALAEMEPVSDDDEPLYIGEF